MPRSQFGDLHLGVYCCGHVFRYEGPILHVAHEPDGDWQFLCGGADHVGDGPYDVHLHHIVDGDPALPDLAVLHRGWEAERPDAGNF